MLLFARGPAFRAATHYSSLQGLPFGAAAHCSSDWGLPFRAAARWFRRMNMEFPLLFSPINVGAMSLKNRVVMSPMLTNYSDAQCGVTPRHLAYYRARALGGAGLIEIEGTAVHPVGRGFPLGLGCWEDAQGEGLAGRARAIHEGGAKAVLQLIHAGRQTVSKLAGAQPVAPSPIPCPRMREMPRELTREDIAELVEAFAQGARRARDAGFDGVELHG